MALSQTLGCPATSVPQVISPWDVLHQSRTRQKASHWRWGRKEKKNFTEDTFFFSPQLIDHIKDCKCERHEELFCDISKPALLVYPCTYLQDEIPILLLLGRSHSSGFLSNFLVWPCSF